MGTHHVELNLSTHMYWVLVVDTQNVRTVKGPYFDQERADKYGAMIVDDFTTAVVLKVPATIVGQYAPDAVPKFAPGEG
jgi:hypothetical protein